MGRSAMPVEPSQSSSESVIDVIDVHRSFGERRALRGVSLTVRRKEIYLLLGPNGAGKSSLVRAICGRLVPDRGSVRVGGGNPRRHREARRGLGLVPQEIALYSELTTRQNLEIFGRLAGVSRADLADAVGQALSWAGLESRRDDRVGYLSGGMQRRLNMAVGMIHRPAVLILDEPTVGVDPESRETILQLLRDLRDEGLGILLTTHDLELAERLADRIGIISEGRIRGEGSLESLVRENFGDARELTVTLRSAPDPGGRDELTRQGLTAARGERMWTGRLANGLEMLSEVEGWLESSTLHVDEVRVREPGLRGVFFRLTGRELDK